MKIEQISVSYSEKRVVDYNSTSHSVSLTAEITEEDLNERPIEQWGYFLDNTAKRMVKKMFGEREEINLTPEDIDKKVESAKKKIKEETEGNEREDSISDVVIRYETDKAYKLGKDGRETWIPKSTVERIIPRKDSDLVDVKLTDQARNWLFKKLEWKIPKKEEG